MQYYRSVKQKEEWTNNLANKEVIFLEANNCGTHGCLVGSLPLSGIKEFELKKRDYTRIISPDKNLFEKLEKLNPKKGFPLYIDKVDFVNYATRLFGDIPLSQFNFLFGGFWYYFDNTVEGAYKRIKYFIENDFQAPDYFYDQDEAQLFLEKQKKFRNYNKMTNQQKQNFKLLAEFVKTIPQEKFDMQYFRSFLDNGKKFEVYVYEDQNCGTQGCIIGNLPYSSIKEFELLLEDYSKPEFSISRDYFEKLVGLGIIQNDKEQYELRKIDFIAYSNRLFVDIHPFDFGFIFGGFWSEYDNTPLGAYKRIRYYIENNFTTPNYFSGELDAEYTISELWDKYND